MTLIVDITSPAVRQALLCAYLLASNAATQESPSGALRVGTTAGLIVLLILPPLALTLATLRPPTAAGAAAPAEHSETLLPASVAAGATDLEQSGPAASAADDGLAHTDAERAAASAPPRLRGQRTSELTLAASIRSTEFLLMFAALSIGGGSALCLINNLGQLTTALHSSVGPESFVALLSVCNAAGRLLQGALADWAMSQGAPPPTFLVCALLLLAVTQLGLASATPASLHLCVALTGLCFGSFWSFAPVACGDLFGECHAGALYGFIGTSPALGSFIFNTLLAGRVYDAHVRLSPPPPPGAAPSGAPRCVGHACFALTFQVCAVACVAGAVCAYVLLVRTRHMYKGRMAQRPR